MDLPDEKKIKVIYSKLKEVFVNLGSLIRLSEIGIAENEALQILGQYEENCVSGVYLSLNSSDYKTLIEFMQ